jgi:hypothetical protein
MSKCSTHKCKGLVKPIYGFIREINNGYEQKYCCNSCGTIYIKRIIYSEVANAGAMPIK